MKEMTPKPHAAEPIRTKAQIDKAKMKILHNENYKFYVLFCMGINTGLRIGDLRGLTWAQILSRDGSVKEYIQIIQQKTKKPVTIKLIDLKDIIMKLRGTNPDDLYLFQSDHHHAKGESYSRQAISNVLNNNIDGVEYLSTHSLRKTFGYMAYKSGIPIAYISERLGHRSVKQTMRYLCITEDEARKAFEGFLL